MDPIYLAQPIFTPRPISPLNFEPLSPKPEDILLPGSSEEDSPATRKRKKRRREAIGAQYLRQQAGYAITFRLKGPFEDGWKNPWAEHGVVLSEKELVEMEKKRRVRERAEEREREEERRGVRASSPIDLTSDAEEDGSIGEAQIMRGGDPGKGKGGKQWLSSNVHRVRQGQQQPGHDRPTSPTPEARYKPQVGLHKSAKERYNGSYTTQLSSPEGQDDEAEDDEDEEAEDELHQGRRTPSIELEYSSSQERLREGSDYGAISDLDMLDMRLPESRPRIERRVLKQRMIDVQNQLKSPHYKGGKKDLFFEKDILKARISALTTEIFVLRDAEKLKAARTTNWKKRGRDGAAAGVSEVSDHQMGRKEQKLSEEIAVQTYARPPTLHAGSSEASTQTSQQSQEFKGLSKSARKRRNRREKKERQQLEASLRLSREPSEEARITSNKDLKQVTDGSSRFEPPLTSPNYSNASSGQPSEVTEAESNKNRKKAVEASRRPDVPLFSAKTKDRASTKKRKFESLPTAEQTRSKEDVNVPAAKSSTSEATPEANATSRRHGEKKKAERALRQGSSPIANKAEVWPGVRHAEENVTNSNESVEAGSPSLESPRRSSFASSQGSSSTEHKTKRQKVNASLKPQLKPQQESPEGGRPSRVPGPMELARELDEEARKNSVDSVNTAWQKDHAGLFGKSLSKGSKAPSPMPEVLPSNSNELPAAVTNSVEQVIDNALGLLSNAVESSKNDQISGVPALSGKNRVRDGEWQSSAASQATNLSEVIDLVTESEHEPGSAAMKATTKKKQPRVLRRARSKLSEVVDLGNKTMLVNPMAPPPISALEQLPQMPQFISFVPKALADAVTMDTQNNMNQKMTKASGKMRVNGVVGSPHVAPSSTSHSEFQYSRINTRSKTDSPATKWFTDKVELLTPNAARALPKRRLSFTPGGNVKRGVEVRVPVVSHEDFQALPSSQEGVQILHAVSSPKQSTTSSKAVPAGKEKPNSGGEVEVLPEAQAPALPAQWPSGPLTNLLETDKQSLKFISTEDDDSMDHFNTQAELAKAQQSFQRDLQSPIKYPTFHTSEEVAQPELPVSVPADEVTSLVTPRAALRSGKDPYAGGPHPDSDSQEPLSTQAMVDAMSPFAISTVKKQGTFLHALTRPATAIFGYIGWGGSSQEAGSQPAGQKPPAEGPPPVDEESVQAPPAEAVPEPEPALEPAVDFGKSGLDMETSDDDAEEFAYELSQPSEFVERRRSGKLDNIIPSEDLEESDFESTLKKQRGMRDDKGRWARVSPQLSQATPSRMTLRSFSSPQGKEDASGEIGQDGQRLTGLETVLDEAGSFLGTWDVEGEVRKLKASGSGSGAKAGGNKKDDAVKGGNGRRRSG
ncbi:hypothetical protein MMC30_002694 [Trapelia coarctata]|nr:hypothetical protein [Trapelia coarctata]